MEASLFLDTLISMVQLIILTIIYKHKGCIFIGSRCMLLDRSFSPGLEAYFNIRMKTPEILHYKS